MPVLEGTQKEREYKIPLEPDSYDLKIIEISDTYGQYGPQIQIRYRVIGEETDDGKPIEFNQWYTIPTNRETGEVEPVRVNSPLGLLFSAALFGGEPYPEGTDLDTDELYGKTVRGLMGDRMTKAQPGKPSRKKFDLLSVSAPKKRKARPEPAPEPVKATTTLKRRLRDEDDEDEDDLEGA